jgi:FkbM family methyltransferase
VRALADARVRSVLAFEPDPRQFELLRMHLALNGGRGTALAFALSDRRERRPMRHGGDANTGLSSLTAEPDAETFDVNCRTADELVFDEGLPAPTLVKIDVEGWESHVLTGFKRILCEKPPRAIVFETDALESGEPVDGSIAAALGSLGYGVRRLPRRSGIIDVRENYLARLETLAVLSTFDNEQEMLRAPSASPHWLGHWCSAAARQEASRASADGSAPDRHE